MFQITGPVLRAADDWPTIFSNDQVRTINLSMASADWNSLLGAVSTTVPASMWLKGEPSLMVQVERKGGLLQSGTYKKPALLIDVNKLVPGQSWHGLQKVNLRIGYAAPGGVIREGLGYNMARLAAEQGLFGYPPTHASWVWVKVQLTDTSEIKDAGLYLHLEHHDDEFLKHRGLYRKRSTWFYLWSGGGKQELLENPIDQQSQTFAWTDSQFWPGAMHILPSPSKPISEWPTYLDIRSLLSEEAFAAYIVHEDTIPADNNILRADFYPAGQKSSVFFPWDLATVPETQTINASIYERNGSPYCDTRLTARYEEVVRELVNGPFSTATLVAYLNQIQGVLQAFADADPNINMPTPPPGSPSATAAYFDHLRQWAGQRATSVIAQIPSGLSAPTVSLTGGNQVQMSTSVSGAQIRYTLNGSDPWTIDNQIGGTLYAASFTLPGTRHVFARVWKDGQWSPPIRQTFVVAGSAATLQIDTFDYRPAEPSSIETAAGFERDDFEFIRFKNVSPTITIDLSGHYVEGVVYTFAPGTQLGPNQTFVLVRNPKAFEMRYPGTAYQGVFWDGKLADMGERLAVHAPDGAIIRSVDYPGLSRLKVMEVHYHPGDGESEFIELSSIVTGAPFFGPLTLDLSGCRFTDGIDYTFPSGTILPFVGTLVLVQNPEAFQARYPGVPYHGVYQGSLANEGERITLETEGGDKIFSFEYDDTLPWPVWPSAFHHSIVNLNPQGDPSLPYNWRASAKPFGSPSAVDPAPLYDVGIVINELLSRPSGASQEDAVELYNSSNVPISVGNWYLSDSFNPSDVNGPALKKYRIPAGTIIPAHAYKAFYASQFDSGANAFAFDRDGDAVYLASADGNGDLTGYVIGEVFGAAEAGVSFGRQITTTGADFVARDSVTFAFSQPATIAEFRQGPGAPNGAPKTGPVVISEIMYHPVPGGTEFVELRNVTAAAVDLTNWRLEGTEFTFPAASTISANGYVLLVDTETTTAAQFRLDYNVPAEVPIFGAPFNLGNDGEAIELQKPNGGSPRILVDRVRYNDKSPWPEQADGEGYSLERLCLSAFANEATNWRITALGGTPGVAHSLPNTPPTIVNIPDVSSAEDRAVPITMTIADQETSPSLLQVVASSSNPTLVPPQNVTISGEGATRTLTIIPAANLFGVADVTVTVSDGCSASLDTFRLTVTSANDAPSFVKGLDQVANDDAGVVTVPNWATSISMGPPDEAAQTANFIIAQNSNPGLFATAPAISPTGTLTFTPLRGGNGTATITVRLQDNGGTLNFGFSTSPDQTFQISVFPIAYHVQIAAGPSEDPGFVPVAALGIDEVGVTTGYGVSGGFEYAFMLDSVEGGGIAARLWTSNPNCPSVYTPGNPFPWTSRGNAVSDGLVVGYIGYDDPTVPSAAIWQNGPTPIVGCGNEIPLYGQVKAYNASGGYLVGYDNGSASSPGGGTAKRGSIFGWTESLSGIAGSTWNVANGVNMAGDAVGASKNPANNRLSPCFWAANGTLTVLPLLAGTVEGEALAINNNGWIVGYCVLSDSRKRGCLWKKVGVNYVATSIGSVNSVAAAINSFNQIVGYQGSLACEFINNVPVDLNTRREASAYSLARAYGINDQGQIVGCTAWGTEGATPPPHFPANYAARAFVLTPHRPTVSVTANATVLSEGGQDVTITFTRTRAPNSLPLKIEFSIPEATQIAELVDSAGLAPRFVTIQAGQTAVATTIHAVEDALNHGNNVLSVVLKSSSAYVIDPANASAQVTINDNDVIAAPSVNQWPGVFDPWKVQKFYIQMTASDSNALFQQPSLMIQPRYSATFRYDDNVYRPVQVWKKDGDGATTRFSWRIDLDNQLWRGLQKLHLRECGNQLPIEGLAWYLHRLTEGTNDYKPGLSAFVELYINDSFKGVFLNAEAFDSQFIENRGLRRKNATWMYKSNTGYEGPREYPNDPPDSPTFLAIGAELVQSAATWEAYFNMDAILTEAAVDCIIGNNDGLVQYNNVNRVDFYFPQNWFPGGPPATMGKSFYVPRDIEDVRFQPSACLSDPLNTVDNVRARQRHFEILQQLVTSRYSESGLLAIVNRMQFMLMDSFAVDPYLKFGDLCAGTLITPVTQFDQLRSSVSSRMSLIESTLETELAGIPARPVFVRNADTITVQNPGGAGSIWYTTDGSDPWTVANGVAPTASVYIAPINLPGTRHLIARVQNGTKWSPATRQTFTVSGSAASLRITEIMYHPSDPSAAEIQAGYSDPDEFEFVELKNTGTTVIDLSDHYFEGIVYKFPPATQILPGEFFVLVRNPKAFEFRYPGVRYQAVYWDGKLDNSGDYVALNDAAGSPLFALTYDDSNPWPTSPDGMGPSLVNQNLAGDPNNSANWRASVYNNGTPGAEDVLAAAVYLRTDADTRGEWVGRYGSQGKTIIGDSSDNPYAEVTLPSGITRLWPSTPDFGGLRMLSDPNQTIQACLHSPENVANGTFDLYVSVIDSEAHQMALYVLDWDANVSSGPRTQRIEIFDARSGTLLNRRIMGSAERGKYLLWNVQGHLRIRFINVSGIDAVLSGIFFDPPSAANPGEFVWVGEPADIANALQFADGDFMPWNWITVNKYAGASAHQSQYFPANALHQHFFTSNPVTITPEPDDELFCWIQVDPITPPSMVMLQWMADDGTWWNHRAYWGANQSPWGINGTASRLPISPILPTAGQWVRLSVPAYKLDLVGRKISGMAYTLVGGKAIWDHAGIVSTLSDTDGDGLPDQWERDHFDNSLARTAIDDDDGDGAINFQEIQHNADPKNSNTDGDTFANGAAFTDGAEISSFLGSGHTDPTLADTDSDWLTDPQEPDYGSDPLKWDSDSDGMPDGEEVFYWGTNPMNPDTDGDNSSDYYEVYYYGTDPLNPNSHP